MIIDYDELVAHLIDQGCTEGEDGDDHGSFFRSCISGEFCYVQKVERFNMTTLGGILYRLKLAAPQHLEDDYEVYKLFKKELDQAVAQLPIPK